MRKIPKQKGIKKPDLPVEVPLSTTSFIISVYKDKRKIPKEKPIQKSHGDYSKEELAKVDKLISSIPFCPKCGQYEYKQDVKTRRRKNV